MALLDLPAMELAGGFDDCQRFGHGVRPFGQESAGGRPALGLQELAGGRDADVVRRGQRLAQAADSPSEAADETAVRAISTSAAKAAGSLTASSARFLRSISTPAALRPWMKRL